MFLTKKENKMLNGYFGNPVKKAMEILVGIGEIFDAKKWLKLTQFI